MPNDALTGLLAADLRETAVRSRRTTNGPRVAAVLAGGFGTRLRSVVNDRPKILAPAAGRPFVAWVLDWLARAGVETCLICGGYRAAEVHSALGGRFADMELVHLVEATPLGTGGAIRDALEYVASHELLVVNGDSICPAEIGTLWHVHSDRHARGTMLLATVADRSRFGAVEVGPHGEVRSFSEKSQAAGPGLINAGVYVLDRGVVEEIPPGRPCSLEREVFPRLIGQGLYGCPTSAGFLDIGVPEDYAQAPEFLARLTVHTGRRDVPRT